MEVLMKSISLIICLSLFAFMVFGQKKPNVILILADDLGYGVLGCYGQQLTYTPNLDKLAKDGIQFTQYYAGTSVCAPSSVRIKASSENMNFCIGSFLMTEVARQCAWIIGKE
jgi:arylsulfatase A-like enzyme